MTFLHCIWKNHKSGKKLYLCNGWGGVCVLELNFVFKSEQIFAVSDSRLLAVRNVGVNPDAKSLSPR